LFKESTISWAAKVSIREKPAKCTFLNTEVIKELAKKDVDWYLIEFVLWLQMYYKPLIMGNT